jgi:small subunit ribosomal protein S4
MARYTEAVCRKCRRAGKKLYLKGTRCYTPKCGVDKRPTAPGAGSGAQKRPRGAKPSDYGVQLREKQNARHIYGVLETQFRRYVTEAQRQRGVTGEALLQQLERRLDNVVYRAGFAPGRAAARQMVRHRHVAVNGKVVDIPAYLVRADDVVEIRPKSRTKRLFADGAGSIGGPQTAPWLNVEPDQFRATVASLPTRDQIDTDINEGLIVEYYAR